FARADDLSPNPIALEWSLKAALRAEDAVLAMRLLDRAAGRADTGSLRETAVAVRNKFTARGGRLKGAGAPAPPCAITLDGGSIPAGEPQWVSTGAHVVDIDTEGHVEHLPVSITAEGTLELHAVRGRPAAEAHGLDQPKRAAETRERGLSPAWFW